MRQNNIYPNEITLAFGGGGVKCYAQIGVLNILERERFHIRGIAATSAGGIVAAMYAAGYHPGEIQAFHEKLKMRSLLKRVRGEGPGLFGLKRAKDAFREILGDRTFADLEIPLILTSVDLNTGQAHMLTEGSVLDALMIAVAIPGLFPPTPRGEAVLLDGGALHPVPISAARSIAPACPVFSVALFPPYEAWDRHPFPNVLQSVPILRHLVQWRLVKAFSIFIRTMDISQRMLAELRLETEKPDLIIRPSVDHLGLFDSVNIAEVVRAGEEATARALFEYHKGVYSPSDAFFRIPLSGKQSPISRF